MCIYSKRGHQNVVLRTKSKELVYYLMNEQLTKSFIFLDRDSMKKYNSLTILMIV